ncbi:MAG: choice-of-anchor D domain-containing protein [Terriglobales bacterium]
MNHIRNRWNAMLVMVSLAGLLGCQGLAPKPQTQGAGQLTPSPASISFGNVQVGTNQSQAGLVTNTGGSSVTITQVTPSGSGFSISGITVPLTLAAGQGANFSVVFAPASPGSASGNITFSSSVGALNVALSGTGVAAGALTTNPTSFSFGNVTLGYSSSQTETLKNTGGESLTITVAAISGAGFSYSGLSLPLTLAPNQASTFGVSFAPTVAGTSSGNLSLTVSGSSTSVDIALSGDGVTPATLTPSPASLTFTNIQVGQSSTQTETVTNTGGSNAQITQVTPSGTGFSVSGITLPVTLIPGQGASFSVTFAPQSAGSFTGNVSVVSNASNSNLSVPLTGSAVSGTQTTLSVTTPINVGNVVVGTSGTQTGTLTATGGTVIVSSVNLGGANPAEFSISGLSFPVTVTTSQPVNFMVTFTPTATGAASATASFASNASNSPTVATLTGTGTAAPVHTVSLSWNASATEGVTSYNVYRAVFVSNSCGSYSDIGSTSSSVTTYTDNNVTDGTTYCYATTAVDANGESAYSNIAEAKIPAP